MVRTVEKFVRFSAGRLLLLNVIAVIAIKLILPYGGAGLADISNTLGPLDTDQIVTQTNLARSDTSLPALVRSPLLDAAAKAKLDDMAAKGYFAHISPTGTRPWDFILRSGYSYKQAGENLARGFSDPTSAVQAWMASPTHRANIVDPTYRNIGVAAARVTIAGRSSIVIVQMFGTPLPTAVKKPAPTPRPKPISATAPQPVSTDSKLGTSRPTSVTIPSGSTLASIGRTLSSALALYLAGVLALLIGAVGVAGLRRTHVHALVAHGTLLALAVALPAFVAGQHLIF